MKNTVISPKAKARGRFLFWAAALAVILAVLLHESLFGGKGLVPADGVLANSPWNRTAPPSNYLLSDQYETFVPQHEFMHQQFMRGHFPLWNPYLGCGLPNLGSMQGALLFPVNLLLMPLDPFRGSGPAAFLKLLLAGLFTMLYLRLIGASDAGAFLAGLVFSLCGFMIVWLGHPHVNCAMWLPLLLYFLEKTFHSEPGRAANPLAAPALRAWIGLAVAFGFMLLGGHPPTAIHITIVMVFYFLFRLAGQWRERPFLRVALLAGSLTAGLLLAAPQILPFLEYYRQSSSDLSSASYARWTFQLPLKTLIHFLVPCISGSPVKGFGDLIRLLEFDRLPMEFEKLPNFNERTVYVGILPLFLSLFAVVSRRCRFTVFFVCLALVSLLVACGIPPFSTLVRALPVLRDINQMRLLLFVAFSLAVLAGFGWDRLRRMENRRQAFLVLMVFWAAIGIGFGGIFWGMVGPMVLDLDPAHQAFLARQLLILAAGLLVPGLLVLWPIRRTRWVPEAVALGWTAMELLYFGMGYNPSIPRDSYYPVTPAIEWLKKDPSTFRVLGDWYTLEANTAEIYGLSDARGCDFMTVRRYEELITGKAGDFWFYFGPTNSALPESFPLLNVKYVLLPRPAAFHPDGYDLVYSNGMAIYRYRACVDRALLVFDHQVEGNPASILARVRSGSFDPRRVLLLEEKPEAAAICEKAKTAMAGPDTSVDIRSYEADEVRIEASLPRPGFLLLLDTYFPGWSASVNGRPAKIYRADYNFRAVALPAGKSAVHFTYQPGSFRVGGVLSAVSLLVLGVAWFRARKRSSGGQDPAQGAGVAGSGSGTSTLL